MNEKTVHVDAEAARAHLLCPAGREGYGGPYRIGSPAEAMIAGAARKTAPFRHVLHLGVRVAFSSHTRMCCVRSFLILFVKAHRFAWDLLDNGARSNARDQLASSNAGLLVRALMERWQRIKQAPRPDSEIVLRAVRNELDALIEEWWIRSSTQQGHVECVIGKAGLKRDLSGRWTLDDFRCVGPDGQLRCNILDVLQRIPSKGRARRAVEMIREWSNQLEQAWPDDVARRRACIQLSPWLLANTVPPGTTIYTGLQGAVASAIRALPRRGGTEFYSRWYPRKKGRRGGGWVRFWVEGKAGRWVGDGVLRNVSLSGAELTCKTVLQIPGTAPAAFSVDDVVKLVCWEIEPTTLLTARVVRIPKRSRGTRKKGAKTVITCGLQYLAEDPVARQALQRIFANC